MLHNRRRGPEETPVAFYLLLAVSAVFVVLFMVLPIFGVFL
jgi:hypothetical protein